MKRRQLILVWALGSLLAGFLPHGVAAQLSPGKLSQPHAKLDGSGACLECHSSGKGVDAEHCLSCHLPLRRQIEAGRGLHTRADYQVCESCHIEHHGREFEIVWWGPEGSEAFDHQLTGFDLEGAHSELLCRDCHRTENIASAARLRAAGKDLDRTFLGLAADCLACHGDQHRGQFARSSCLSCHGQEAWRPASLFEHDRSAFPLTGQHREVSCEQCHRAIGSTDGDGWTQYRGVASASCADCHQDPHRQRLGDGCASCHVTDGWGQVEIRSFDHDRTRYPLRGRHRDLACESCHGAWSTDPGSNEPGPTMRIVGFELCATCHSDPHLGQFRGRADGDDCGSCHGFEGFMPPRFTPEDHRRGHFPLLGAHQAVPCAECHREVPVAELAAATTVFSGDPQPATVRQFRFASTTCVDCHRDPHLGDADPYLASDGCLSCHRMSGWREIDFDHQQTGYELAGRHREIACRECHLPVASGTDQAEVRLAGLRPANPSITEISCRTCHEDAHFGQFDSALGLASCEDCHGVESWRAVGFDHDRDAAFSLQGAHARVACDGCHPVESMAGQSFVRFRPLGQACSDCHLSEVVMP